MLKVAFIADDSSSMIGGVGWVTNILVENFKKKGIESYLIYKTGTSNPSTKFQDKFNYRSCGRNEKLLQYLLDKKISIIINQCVSSIIDSKTLRLIANKCDCHIVSVIHAKPDLVKVFPSVRSLTWEIRRAVTILDWLINFTKILLFPIYKPISSYKYYLWRKSIYVNSNYVVVLSKHYIEVLRDYLRLNNSCKIKAIPNPLRFEDFYDKELISEKCNEVLVVSRLDEGSKKLSRVFDIWEILERDTELKEWKLIIVGGGDYEGLYRKLVRLKGLKNVIFEGIQNPERYYKRAKIFLMTSAHEGFPMTILEAIQMGVPVVAFDNFESIHELIINDYNGLIINNNDIINYANGLSQLMKNDSRRARYASNAIDYSHNFSVDKVIEKWLTLFETMTNESPISR